jgi:hypothetical protein
MVIKQGTLDNADIILDFFMRHAKVQINLERKNNS